MIKINPSQIYMSVQTDADFAEWYVTEFMPTHVTDMDAAVSAEGKREMTIQGRRYAESFDVEDIPSQYHFVTLMWKVAPNFFTFPVFNRILSNSTLSDRQKMERCYDVSGEDAAEVIVAADDRWWYPELIDRKEGQQ